MPRAWTLEILGAPPRWERTFLGSACHALVFDLLRVKAPTLATALHDRPGSKPFSLTGPRREADGRVLLSIRVIDPELEATLHGWFDALLLPVRLLGEAITLRAVSSPPGQVSAWSWSDRASSLEAVPVPEGLRLELLSPTLFRVDGQDVSWPETRLVLRSWQHRWRTASPVEVEFVDPENLASRIIWSDYHLEARRFRAGHVQGCGATGFVEWRFRAGTPDSWKQQTRWLADWGTWIGTGAKTAFGLGETVLQEVRAGLPRALSV